MSPRQATERATSTGGRAITATGRDRGPMATRYASIQPEEIAAIQRGLDEGRLTDWDDLCSRMLQRDPDIFAPYESRLSVVSGAELVVEPGIPTGDPERDAYASACASWVESWLRAMPVSRYAHESLDGIGRGLAVHEIIWSDTDRGLVPVCLEWLSLRRFCYAPDWTPRIVDMGDGDYAWQGYTLEADRFVTHEPRVIPGYPTGGALRVVMWLFLIKSWALQFWTAGAESFAWPLRVATAPRSSGDSARDAAKRFLEDLSADHAAVLDEGMVFQLLETTAKDGNVWANLIETCNRGIAKALLGMTDMAEPTKVGSYAAVETRKGATVDARVLKDERALAATWERDIVEPAVRRNVDRWGGVTPPIPRLRWSIAAKRENLDPIGVLALTVDEVRAAQGKDAIGGMVGAQLWRDYSEGKSPIDPAAAATDQPVADTAMNGAQVSSLLEIQKAAASGELPRPSAIEALLVAFPTIDRASAERLVPAPSTTPPLAPTVPS